jgi:hypothetical protein
MMFQPKCHERDFTCQTMVITNLPKCPPKKVAITFSGWANDDKIKDLQRKLIAALDKDGMIPPILL